MKNSLKLGVIGGGAWGTALAVLGNRTGSSVTLWTKNPNVLESIHESRVNESYLPDIFIDPAIRVTAEMSGIAESDMLLLVVPAQSLRSVCIAIVDHVQSHVPLVICAKGIERGSLALMSEVVGTVMPLNPIAILSGPNFADEAARGQPTATTIACEDTDIGEKILFALGGKHFRPYLTDDVIGTQIGGAVKNVIAIACGIAMGRNMGENSRAALITRSIAEISRLCVAKGGRLQTLMGLSGIGDLILTCSSPKSRNMAFGLAIGQGKALEDLMGQRKGVVEGVATAESVTQLASKLGVVLPICNAIYGVVSGKVAVEAIIDDLLERPFSQE